MIWLYRLQQRLSITRHEGIALLTLTTLFVMGLTVRHVQEQQVPPVAVDSLVAQPAAKTAGPSFDSNTPDAETTPAASTAPTPDNPLNLNSASRQALQTLNGIGPALSKRIIEYRSTQQPFQTVEELKRVDGIGPKTLADLRPVVTVKSLDTP
jgi:competence protein ComEA